MAQEQGILIVAEIADGALAGITAELATLGRSLADELGQPLIAALIGSGVESLASELGALGVDRVIVADDAALAGYDAEAHRDALLAAVSAASPLAVILGQTANGRDLAPRVAFRLQTGLVTDCTAIQADTASQRLVMTKPVYGGSALAEYTVETVPQIATLRPRVIPVAESIAARTPEVESIDIASLGLRARIKAGEIVQAEAVAGPKLKDAKIVVSGGRGIGSAENWPAVEELAGALSAATGASRAVTDAGWVAPALQVGLTGTTIAPDLYITVGISGALQHIAGCSGARNIVAINKDPDANIFKNARYGVVGDYKEVLPAFTKRVKELRGG